MAIEVDPSEAFEAVYESGTPGLVGALEVAIHDNQSTVVYGPTALQISELIVGGTPTGTYRANLVAPAAEGQYTINWSNDGSFDPQAGSGVEDLIVADTTLTLPSLGPDVAGGVLCSAWTTVEALSDCCSAVIGSDTSLAEAAIVAASEILYEASGRQWVGICERTVRPCDPSGLCACGTQVLSRGHLVGWSDSCWSGGGCGCMPVSQVKLAGHVREISEVKIDGVVIDPSGYFVERGRYLIRRSPDRWPSCQTMDLPDTEPGTFSVTYSYGKAPPVAGQLAAAALACETIQACTPGVECALPQGVTRVTRQGITYERTFFVRNRDGVWATGIGAVDIFLNAFNSNGLRRRAVFWSPSSRGRYARPSPS